ncbi:MAG: thiamine pyrophosphate-binding protein [Gemmataceae bacterium]
MESAACPQTVADAVVQRLRDHDVAHVFGYPGGQLTPLYDALCREPAIRHVLARDEQAAAFMADGYARATGKPGVCLAVCGPGVLNAATPLATAFTDSIPLLLISGQVPVLGRGPRSGYYHENDQLHACTSFTKWRCHIDDPRGLITELDRAFRALTERRPGPVLVEVPLDVQRTPFPHLEMPPLPPTLPPLAPRPSDITELVELIAGWKRPVLLAGGGVLSAGACGLLAQLAERLGAPVLTTLMGKSAFPGDHPLAAGLPWHQATSDLTNMEPLLSPALAEADAMLAIGCRFTQAATGSWVMKPPPQLVHIDIDGAEIGRHYAVTLGIQADAAEALRALLAALPEAPRLPWHTPVPLPRWRLRGLELLDTMRPLLPRDAIIVGDITRLTYMMLAQFPIYEPRSFLHPAGFVSMGFGLPAALGAKLAFPQRPVVTIMGDGCFQMTGMELATAVQEKLPVIVILMNDSSLTLIKAIQQRRYEGRYFGVDLRNPDFGLFAQAFGVRYWRAASDPEFATALRQALDGGESGLIEVQVGDRID